MSPEAFGPGRSLVIHAWTPHPKRFKVRDHQQSWSRLRPADAHRSTHGIRGDRSTLQGGIQHRSRHHLGFALSVHTLHGELGKHDVDPARGQLVEAQAPEVGNDELSQHPLILVDRGVLEPPIGPKLKEPQVDEFGDRGVSGDGRVHRVLLR